MNLSEDLLERWIDALRGGGYLQGKSYLHKQVGKVHYYCCLGVLCDLAGVPADPNYDPNEGEYVVYFYEFEPGRKQTGATAGELYDWIASNGLEESYLINMNDRYNKTFADIADLIESVARKEVA